MENSSSLVFIYLHLSYTHCITVGNKAKVWGATGRDCDCSIFRDSGFSSGSLNTTTNHLVLVPTMEPSSYNLINFISHYMCILFKAKIEKEEMQKGNQG